MKKNGKIQPLVSSVVVRLGGTGGQGLLLAGRLLAEAAALYDERDILLTNSYGPEARGGASRSEVVIGKGEIDILHASKVDVLVCLSQSACDKYYDDLSQDGLLIVDATNVTVVPTSRVVEVPMTALAVNELGNRMVTNVISVGVLAGVTKLISEAALMQAVEGRAPEKFRDLNIRAAKIGFRLGCEMIADKSPRFRKMISNYSFEDDAAELETAQQGLQRKKAEILAPPTKKKASLS